jgi:hypothetical protein
VGSDGTSEPEYCCPLDDDADIPNDAVLYRRLPEHNLAPAPDRDPAYRPTSNCFQDPDPFGVSVYVAALLHDLGLSADDVTAGMGPGLWGVAEFTAGQARDAGFGVRLRPDPAAAEDLRNPAHAELTGLLARNAGGRQSKKLSKPPTRVVHVAVNAD